MVRRWLSAQLTVRSLVRKVLVNRAKYLIALLLAMAPSDTFYPVEFHETLKPKEVLSIQIIRATGTIEGHRRVEPPPIFERLKRLVGR